MKRFRFLIVGSFVLNIVLLMTLWGLVYRLGGFQYVIFKATIGNQLTGMGAGRTEHFQSLSDDSHGVIFLGDSITQQAEWSEFFKNTNVKNRGIGGNTAKAVLSRLDEIISADPDKIFLMIGINDLVSESPANVAKTIGLIVDRILKETESTQVYLESILPVNNHIHQTGVSNEEIRQVNLLLAGYSQQHERVTWIDLTPFFSDNRGQLNKVLTYDGLHLNGRAYEIWRDHLLEYLSISVEPENRQKISF